MTDQITEDLKAIPGELQGLLLGTGYFDNVRLGAVENILSFKGRTATVYMRRGDTETTMGSYNLPLTIEAIIGVLVRGARDKSHTKTYEIILDLLDKFRNNTAWTTLNGRVRHASVEEYEVFPYNTGRTYITTGILRVKLDVRRRIR